MLWGDDWTVGCPKKTKDKGKAKAKFASYNVSASSIKADSDVVPFSNPEEEDNLYSANTEAPIIATPQLGH